MTVFESPKPKPPSFRRGAIIRNFSIVSGGWGVVRLLLLIVVVGVVDIIRSVWYV
jgi:hypothetical protein